MGRPRKYATVAEARQGKAESDRTRYRQQQEPAVQAAPPRFIPYMPVPSDVPPATPAYPNLRTDIPALLNPQGGGAWAAAAHVSEVRRRAGRDAEAMQPDERPWLAQPVLTTLLLGASADDAPMDDDDGALLLPSPSPPPFIDDEDGSGDPERARHSAQPTPTTLLRGASAGATATDDDGALVRSSLSVSAPRQQQEPSLPQCQAEAPPLPAAAQGAEQGESPPPPPPAGEEEEEEDEDEEDEDEDEQGEDGDAIITHLAEQLHHFQGCKEAEHQKEAMRHVEDHHEQANVSPGCCNLADVTERLQGIYVSDDHPLPNVLGAKDIMEPFLIQDCDLEQVFEGRISQASEEARSGGPAAHRRASIASHESRSSSASASSSLPSVSQMARCPGSTSASTSASPLARPPQSALPIELCLETYHHYSVKEREPEVSFDIDSTCCFPSSLAVARGGIRVHATVNEAANLTASNHFAIRTSRLNARHELEVASVPLFQVPHYSFGTPIGLDEMEMFIFFPSLRQHTEYKTSTFLSTEDQDYWFDCILLPCLDEAVASSNTQQHLSPSKRVADLEAGAASAEGYRVKISSRRQILRYVIQPEHLEPLWNLICARIEEAVAEGMPSERFAQPLLFMANKNTKLQYMLSGHVEQTLEILPRAFSLWHENWMRGTDERFYTKDNTFVDIAKQTTSPDSALPPAPLLDSALSPEVYLWRTCCLNRYLKMRVHKSGGGGGGGSGRRRRGRRSGRQYPDVARYPFATMSKAGGMTIASPYGSRAQKAGVVYSQFYNLIKTPFDAAKVYIFNNEALENLALDPSYVEGLRYAGRGISFSLEACRTSYCHSKARAHASLHDNQWRSFGTREEHRVSLAAAESIMERWQELRRQQQRAEEGGGDEGARHMSHQEGLGTPYFIFASADMFAFLRAQINRFCFLFEYVYSWLGETHSLEEFTMMVLALRGLRFCYGSAIIQAESTLYRDRWRTRAGEVREGIGMGVAMAHCGFGWFLPKINWSTFRVRPSSSSQLLAGAAPLHQEYRRRWRAVRDLGNVYTRFNQAQGWVSQYRIPSDGHKTRAWLKYLTILNMAQFRADIAQHMLASNTKHPELSAKASAAATATAFFSNLSYCWSGMRDMFEVDGEAQPPHTAMGNRVQVASAWELLELLFGWEEMTPRQRRTGAWRKKPYRIICQKTFDLVRGALGPDAAWRWYEEFLATVMATHWVLPYANAGAFLPTTKTNKNQGLRPRTTWFSTVLEERLREVEPFIDEGKRHVRRSLGAISHHIRESGILRRRRGGGGGGGRSVYWEDTDELLNIFDRYGVLLKDQTPLRLDDDDKVASSRMFFRLGFRQVGTALRPVWEGGRPIPLRHLSRYVDMSLGELDEFMELEMGEAERTTAEENRPRMPARVRGGRG